MASRDTKVMAIWPMSSETMSGRLTSSRFSAKMTMMVDDATIAPRRSTSRSAPMIVQVARRRYMPTSHDAVTHPSA